MRPRLLFINPLRLQQPTNKETVNELFTSFAVLKGHGFTGCGKKRLLVELTFRSGSKPFIFDPPSGL